MGDGNDDDGARGGCVVVVVVFVVFVVKFPAVEPPPSPVLPNETVGGVILSAEAQTSCVALLGWRVL